MQLKICHQLLSGRTHFLLLLPLRLRSQLMVAPSPTQCSQEARTAKLCHELDIGLSVLSVTGSQARLSGPPPKQLRASNGITE